MDDRIARGAIEERPLGWMFLLTLEHAEWRAAIRAYLEETPGATRTSIARDMGLRPHVILSLMDGGQLEEEHAEVLRSWGATRPRPFVHAEQVAVDFLTLWVGASRRPAARAELAAMLLDFYSRQKVKLPPTVEVSIGT